MIERVDFLKEIQANIKKSGYHVTMVSGNTLPRFAYTIGCKDKFGFELIFAGGEFYSKKNVQLIIDSVFEELKNESEWYIFHSKINSLGSFTLGIVQKSWSEKLALGVFDFYGQDEVPVVQILPDKEHSTLDVPDMSKEFSVTSEPIWKWLVREWNYPVDRNSIVVTNLKVLFGEKATEMLRCEANEWEIFAGEGPNIPKEDMRALPLAVLLGIDKSLEPAIYLEIGKGLMRDPVELEWYTWG